MAYKLPAKNLKSLYSAMLAEGADEPSSAAERVLKDIAKEGWAHNWRVEDLILMSDRRLDDHNLKVDLEVIARSLRLPMQSVCMRPTAKSNNVVLHQAWSAIDAASLFIALEMLGFAIDPAPLVDAVRPTLPKKGYITSAGLDILWYGKRRHKSRITFERDNTDGPLQGHEAHLLRNGYKLIGLLDLDGEPVSLTVTGPRYRQRPEPVEEKCLQCGDAWFRGDPDSSASHRRTHRRRMAVLEPQPNERVLSEMAANTFSEHVDWRSPEWRHREMTTRASSFRREQGYDFTQWGLPETDTDAHGFLFTNSDGRIVGACAFRLRQYEGRPERWGLQWVWVAPSHRRTGVLRSRWAAMRQRFHDFDIEAPVSPAMQSFARTMGDGHLL